MHKSLCFVCCLALWLAPAAFGQRIGDPLSEERNVYQKIADIDLTIDDGRRMKLSDLYRRRPVIIAQIFTQCTGVCSPSIMQLKKNLEALRPRQPYTVLVVSFDPRDTGADLRHFAHRLSVNHESHWLFATTDQIGALNESIGFEADFDKATGQFNHDALLTGVNRQGIIKRKLLGIRGEHAVADLISEINNGFTASYPLPGKSKILSCFNYNSAGGGVLPGTGFLIMLVPSLMTVMLVGFLGFRAHRTL